MTDATNDYRPPVEDRWVDGMRTEPGSIAVHTEWLYVTERGGILPPGRTRHPFARGGHVVTSDFPSRSESSQSVLDHVHRAVEAFGDDKDLVIEVRLATADELAGDRRAPAKSPTRDELVNLTDAFEQRPTQSGRYAEVGRNDHYNSGAMDALDWFVDQLVAAGYAREV